ncbi:MAG: phasin family protein [Alphaproteobacteria bacterium]|nr:phasin family protein [Alphaproteobacteria bacterium]
MFKLEDFEKYGKAQFEQAVTSAASVQNGVSAIASVWGDYAKKSFEDTRFLVERLAAVKSFDKAIEVQSDFVRSSYETYVAEAQKIAGLCNDLGHSMLARLQSGAH